MAEKRDSERRRERYCVKFGVETERRISFTDDISPEGLFIQTAYVLQPGTAVEVDLILDDDSSVALEGQVMWAKKAPRGMPARLAKGGSESRSPGSLRELTYTSGYARSWLAARNKPHEACQG